jgi:hypothetical protein
MKILITESQFVDLFFKRRFGRIDKLVDEKMRYYPPCDYTYDPFYAWYDYYGDVRNAVIFKMFEKGINVPQDIVDIDVLSETMNEWMYEQFYDKVREYYDKVLEDEDCDE